MSTHIPFLIGLGHRKRVGKNTVAAILHGLYGSMAVIDISLAKPVKYACNAIWGPQGLREPQYYEDHPEEKEIPLSNGLSPREIMIRMASAIRQIDPDALPTRAFNVSTFHQIGIVTDLRFPNELEFIRRNHGIAIRIDRPGIPFDLDDPCDNALADATWDVIVNNDGDLSQLSLKVSDISRDLILPAYYIWKEKNAVHQGRTT